MSDSKESSQSAASSDSTAMLVWKFLGNLILFILGVTLLVFAASSKYIGNYNYSHPTFLTCTVASAEPAKWGLSDEQLNEKNTFAELKIETEDCGEVRYNGYAYGKSLNELTSYINSQQGQEIKFKVPAINISLKQDTTVGSMKIGELDYDRWDITTNSPSQ